MGVAAAATAVLLAALHGRQSSPTLPPTSPGRNPRRAALSPSTEKPTLKIGAADHGHCCQMPRAFAFSRRFREK